MTKKFLLLKHSYKLSLKIGIPNFQQSFFAYIEITQSAQTYPKKEGFPILNTEAVITQALSVLQTYFRRAFL